MYSSPFKGKGKDLREIEYLLYVKYLTHIFTKPPGNGALIISILKMRILRLRDMNKLAPNHTTDFRERFQTQFQLRKDCMNICFPRFLVSTRRKYHSESSLPLHLISTASWLVGWMAVAVASIHMGA